MRMDRYDLEDKNNNDAKQSRLNKNQELYTDVYLNNVYVDINSIKDVMKEEKEVKEVPKPSKEIVDVDYTYEEKNYDINAIIEEVLKNQETDNKNNVNILENDEKIASVIESINEKAEEEKKEQADNELLADLMPSSENTEVIPPLTEPILDTSVYREPILVLPDDETDEYDLLTDDIKEEDMEEDDSFVGSRGNKVVKVVVILGTILVIIAIVVVLKLLKVF